MFLVLCKFMYPLVANVRSVLLYIPLQILARLCGGGMESSSGAGFLGGEDPGVEAAD